MIRIVSIDAGNAAAGRQEFDTDFERVCRLIKANAAQGGPVRATSPAGVEVIAALRNCALSIASPLRGHWLAPRLSLQFSRGQSNLPTVHWLAVTVDGQKVFKDPSVTICFGKKGEGAVAGLMMPARVEIRGLTPIRRSDRKITVDVNGPKLSNRYNDRFVNPIELRVGAPAPQLTQHLLESIDLLAQHLGETVEA